MDGALRVYCGGGLARLAERFVWRAAAYLVGAAGAEFSLNASVLCGALDRAGSDNCFVVACCNPYLYRHGLAS